MAVDFKRTINFGKKQKGKLNKEQVLRTREAGYEEHQWDFRKYLRLGV